MSKLYILYTLQSLWTELDVKSIESLNGTNSFPIGYDIRVKRIRKGVYGLTGTIEITDSIDDYIVRGADQLKTI